MKRLLLSTLLLGSTILPAKADILRLRVPLDVHLKGENTVFIKQELRRKNPRVDLRQLELKKVIAVAKSKQGQGKISLKVGQETSLPEVVYGSPIDFHDPSRDTFDRVVIHNPSIRANGVWQLKTKGNIKIKHIVVVAKEKRRTPPAPRLETVTLGQFKVDKFIEDLDSVQVNLKRVKSISIQALKKGVEVHEAVALLEDGTRVDLRRLEGSLKSGRTKEQGLRVPPSLKIKKVKISATTIGVVGSRANIKVTAKVLR